MKCVWLLQSLSKIPYLLIDMGTYYAVRCFERSFSSHVDILVAYKHPTHGIS